MFARTPSISPAEAADGLLHGSLTVVDVRDPDELRDGRIPGARNIPLGQLARRLDEFERGRRVAFVCHSGMRSLRAAKAAAKAGVDAVSVRGGVVAWSQSGLPLTR